MSKVSEKTGMLTGLGVLVAVIIILQTAFGSIQIGPFTITLTLIPIIIGATLYGPAAGALLGLVFGIVVAIQAVTGAAGAGTTMMLEFNPAATIGVCLLKGAVAGLGAGFGAKLAGEKNLLAGIFIAAVIAPVLNTGIFIIFLVTVFLPIAQQWSAGAGASSVGSYVLAGIVGINFVVELVANLVLSPVIFRIIRAVRSN